MTETRLASQESAAHRESSTEDVGCIATILAAKSREEADRAYRSLMTRHWRLVVVLAAARVRDRREAEDIAQETFVRAFRSLKRLKRPKAFPAWLLRIARNVATDHLRARKPTVPLESVADSDLLATTSATHREAAFVERVAMRDEAERALRAVRELPEKYREVVALRYLSGFDGRTIAKLLDEPEGTVRNRLFRALKKLRNTLQSSPEKSPRRISSNASSAPKNDLARVTGRKRK
jgi:RNA polymerase sigma-70 factor (ECF subfamily)